MRLRILCLILCSFPGTWLAANTENSEFPLKEGALVTCFMPGGNCHDKFLAYINSATKTLDLAAYHINLASITDALIQKAKDVSIRIVVDPEKAKMKKSLIPTLKKAGIKVRFGVQVGHMHNKFTIIDERTVATGSFNYTQSSFQNNQENQVYIANARAVKEYTEYFKHLWETSSDPQEYQKKK